MEICLTRFERCCRPWLASGTSQLEGGLGLEDPIRVTLQASILIYITFISFAKKIE
jgi:hypothetical protein